MTVDPILGSVFAPTGMNPYLYASSDPVNSVDPSGLATAAEYGIVAAAVAAGLMAEATRQIGRTTVRTNAISNVGLGIACSIDSVTNWMTVTTAGFVWSGQLCAIRWPWAKEKAPPQVTPREKECGPEPPFDPPFTCDEVGDEAFDSCYRRVGDAGYCLVERRLAVDMCLATWEETVRQYRAKYWEWRKCMYGGFR
jgi:hypothetical protein